MISVWLSLLTKKNKSSVVLKQIYIHVAGIFTGGIAEAGCVPIFDQTGDFNHLEILKMMKFACLTKCTLNNYLSVVYVYSIYFF